MSEYNLKDEDLENFKEYRSIHEAWGNLNYVISKKIDSIPSILQFAEHAWKHGDSEGASLLVVWSVLTPGQRKKVLRYAEPRKATKS